MVKQEPDVGLQQIVLMITVNNIAQTTKTWRRVLSVYYFDLTVGQYEK
jgi:hypothetical protein